MDIEIEKELLEYKTHIVDYASIKSILVNMGYTRINDKINLMYILKLISFSGRN